jgi:agmatinase
MVGDSKLLGLSSFGVASFLKAPLVAADGDWSADVAFLGIPFDQATGFRPGTRFGPRAIRDISVRMSSLSAGERPGYFDLRSGLTRAVCSFADVGDVDILPLLWERNFDLITQSVTAILSKRALPLIAGGDHSVSFPIIRAYAGHEPITVVQFDAHLDYRDDAGGVRYGHGNVLRRVRELPFVEQIVSLGIRSLRTRREDRDAHAQHGNILVPAWDIHAKGPDGVADLLPRNRNVYVTFDIDAFDASIVPGTGTPEVGGLTYEQARRLLELVITGNRLVGFDMVEVNPSLDPSQITALLALQIMVEAVGLVFSR